MSQLNFDSKACSREVGFKSLYSDEEVGASNPIKIDTFEDDEYEKNDEQIMRSLDCLACMNGTKINYRKYN